MFLLRFCTKGRLNVKNLYDPISQPYVFFRNTTKIGKSSPLTPYHRHNAFEIYLFLSGSRRMCVENAAYVCRPGDLFLIRPETFHAGLCDAACEYDRIIMNVRPEFLAEICEKGAQVGDCFDFEGKNPIRRTHLGYHERKTAIELFGSFAEAQESSDPASALLCDTYVLQFLIFVNRWFRRDDDFVQEDNVMPQLVSDVMDYINDNVTEDVTMEKLAERFHFHGRYLSKLFRDHTGLTIRTYILDRRIALAQKLLGEGCNVSEACWRSGFNDYANFLRSFKKHAGISPGRYKRECRTLQRLL